MAILASAQWELQSAGNTHNGGGYDPGIPNAGADYSQQSSPVLTVSDGVTNGTTLITSVTGGFTASMIGNAIYESGTTTARYFIVAVPTTNQLTLDRATGDSGSGRTVSVGGALGSGDLFACCGSGSGYAVAGNYVFLKYAAGVQYTVATACAVPGTDSNTGRYFAIVGYDILSTRNLSSRPANRPIIQATANVNLFTTGQGLSGYWRNLILDTNNQGSSAIVVGNGGNYTVYRCDGINGQNAMFSSSTSANYNILTCIECYGSTIYSAFANCTCIGCLGNYNFAGSYNTFANCLAINCIAISSFANHGSGFAPSNGLTMNCIAYNYSVGFELTIGAAFNPVLLNCLAHTCPIGFDNAGLSTNSVLSYGIAYYNCSNVGVATAWNTNTLFNGSGSNVQPIQCTVDPCVGVGVSNFTINNAPNGGALLRAAGYGLIGDLSTLGYPDIGAFQSQNLPIFIGHIVGT